MSTPLEVIEEGVHMKGLEKSKNAKECGDLTVLPLGYLSSIHKSQTLALLQALHDELKVKKIKQKETETWDTELKTIVYGRRLEIQDQQDNLQALMDKIRV